MVFTQVYAQLARLRAIQTNDVRRRESHNCSKTEFYDCERIHPTDGKTRPFLIYTKTRWILDTLSAYRAVQEASKGSILGQEYRKTRPASAPPPSQREFILRASGKLRGAGQTGIAHVGTNRAAEFVNQPVVRLPRLGGQSGYPRSMESPQVRKSGLAPVVDEDTEILILGLFRLVASFSFTRLSGARQEP